MLILGQYTTTTNNKLGNIASVFFTVHIANVNYKYSVKFQLKHFHFFKKPQPELVLKLFLVFGQSDPHCSYHVVLIKKRHVSMKYLYAFNL